MATDIRVPIVGATHHQVRGVVEDHLGDRYDVRALRERTFGDFIVCKSGSVGATVKVIPTRTGMTLRVQHGIPGAVARALLGNPLVRGLRRRKLADFEREVAVLLIGIPEFGAAAEDKAPVTFNRLLPRGTPIPPGERHRADAPLRPMKPYGTAPHPPPPSVLDPDSTAPRLADPGGTGAVRGAQGGWTSRRSAGAPSMTAANATQTRCPSCAMTFPVPPTRPVNIQCPKCGRAGVLK